MEQIYLLISSDEILKSVLGCLYANDIIQLSKSAKLFHSFISQAQVHLNIKAGCLNSKGRPAFWTSMLPIQK
jgi:hypothetical protein